MKLNEQIGIFYEAHTISPEAFKAQRQAELADIAEFRRRRLTAIKKWGEDSAHRDVMKAVIAAEERQARREVAAEAQRFAKMYDEQDRKQVGSVTPTYKPPFKPSLIERLADWLGRFFA